MPRFIALEWDDAEARVAVAEVRRGGITLEHAFSVSLPGALAPGGAASAEIVSMSGAHDLGAIGRRISETLLARGIRKQKTLVAVGRANIELKNLSLPPAPMDELPELVRFQAEREFNALGDDWPLDFIPLPSAADEPQSVLAAAISPELVGEIEVTCEAAGLSPERLVLRPCSAAALLSHVHPAQGNGLRLLVDLLADEADLTVLAGDTVVFLRTTRLQHELLASDPLRALLPEIRRTIAAVQNRLQGQAVQEVFLCGAGPQQESLVRDIGRDLNLPAELLNPLASCQLTPELQRSPPADASRFAPLVGMLIREAVGGAAVIDFLNPRKNAVPASNSRKYALPVAAVATLLLAGMFWAWWQYRTIENEIQELTQKSQSLDPNVEAAKKQHQQAAQVEHWLSGDIVWLDELATISERAPSNREVVVTSLASKINQVQSSAPRAAQRGAAAPPPMMQGVLTLDGMVRDRELWVQLQGQLRDENRSATVPRPVAKADAGADKYPWAVQATIRVTKESPLKSSPPVLDAKSQTSRSNPAQANKADPVQNDSDSDQDDDRTDKKSTDSNSETNEPASSETTDQDKAT